MMQYHYFQNYTIITCYTYYARGGQTCSMYEPHIVKPKLHRAAT